MSSLQVLDFVGAAVALVLLVTGFLGYRRLLRHAREEARRILAEARTEAEGKSAEILVAAQEKALAASEEAERREGEIDQREAAVEVRSRDVEAEAAAVERQRKEFDRRNANLTRNEEKVRESLAAALAAEAEARRALEHAAGMTAEEARAELLRGIEDDARKEGARIARRIEDESRERAHRDAVRLVVDAAQRIPVREAVESAVTFVRLPSDEMKGRIIGREGRNIRALEFATGIDVIVDDTPQAILIASFDPVRREVARVAIDRLIEDGRIHPAKIEETVAKVKEEFDGLVEESGRQAAFELGLAELPPRIARLVGRMKYRYHHGHNLLQHSLEVALIAGHMASEVGARPEIARRAGLLHEIGRVDENASGHTILAAAELAAKTGEKEPVVQAIQSLHPDFPPKTVEALLLRTANRLSENRPGARKDNLDAFIDRMRRLEAIVTAFPGVSQAYAVRAGKEVRVLVDTTATGDDEAYVLAKEVARALERELEFPGEIKVSVVRETRAVQYAV